MKILGVLGGTGPESTIDYYKLLLEVHREKNPDGGNAPLLINSVNFKRIADFMASDDWEGIASFFAEELNRLATAGAQVGLIAANTPHRVFDQIQAQCVLPLISIVEAAVERTKDLGFRKVGLLGTRITMSSGYYQKVFEPAGVQVCVPDDADQEYVNRKYFDELFVGVILDETREGLANVVRRLVERDRIEALILGGTELPLILRNVEVPGVPFLDTARIHVEAAIDHLLDGC